jgi:hypothetical protein
MQIRNTDWKLALNYDKLQEFKKHGVFFKKKKKQKQKDNKKLINL